MSFIVKIFSGNPPFIAEQFDKCMLENNIRIGQITKLELQSYRVVDGFAQNNNYRLLVVINSGYSVFGNESSVRIAFIWPQKSIESTDTGTNEQMFETKLTDLLNAHGHPVRSTFSCCDYSIAWFGIYPGVTK